METSERKIRKFQAFVEKAIKKHGDKYTYPEQDYEGCKKKVRILCKEHGEFTQTPDSHVQGGGCPKCGNIKKGEYLKPTWDEFVKKALEIHKGLYTYEKQEYINAKTKISITCAVHGDFSQIPDTHLRGQGCAKCKNKKLSVDRICSFKDFVKKANATHGGLYEYPEQEYKGAHEFVIVLCKEHGAFTQSAHNHIQGSACPKCSGHGTSIGEIKLFDAFKIHGVSNKHWINLRPINSEVRRTDGSSLNRMELDLYFKQKNIAVEFNGLYWHNEQRVGKEYHKGKTDACNELGIDLIQIFEDEWEHKPEIVKSIINTRLGSYENRYYARKTQLICVDASTAGSFYEKNHIQGKTACSTHYGLTIDGELVAMASFGDRSRLFKNNNDIELIRFCTKLNTQVVGGLSKLLATHKDVNVKTYCDLRLFNGAGYKAVGFKELHKSEPAYYYLKGNKRLSRFGFQKHKLEKALTTFDASLTEVENMKANGYSRIFDCGTLVMVREPSTKA